jgi:purine-cytosine permease-like protein
MAIVISVIFISIVVLVLLTQKDNFIEKLWVQIVSFTGIAIWGFFLYLARERHLNHANIENYKKSLEE